MPNFAPYFRYNEPALVYSGLLAGSAVLAGGSVVFEGGSRALAVGKRMRFMQGMRFHADKIAERSASLMPKDRPQ